MLEQIIQSALFFSVSRKEQASKGRGSKEQKKRVLRRKKSSVAHCSVYAFNFVRLPLASLICVLLFLLPINHSSRVKLVLLPPRTHSRCTHTLLYNTTSASVAWDTRKKKKLVLRPSMLLHQGCLSSTDFFRESFSSFFEFVGNFALYF